jgi:uncharacterized protein YdeI (YjbR/CyaY-like superfamily)
MELEKTLYVTDRRDWRSWLSKNHDKEKEVWLVYYRKSTGKPRISYNDAVEEALCYGWIDSIQRGIDEQRFAQRFSPRKPNSVLSEPNRQRIRKLIKEGLMTDAGLEAVRNFFNPSKEDKFIIAPDILKPLKANIIAWKNFQNFPESYQRVRVAFIESRRRHGKELFDKSLAHLIKKTEKNKKFGLMK